MKKGTLLNSAVSSLVSRLGHTDSVVIADAGLPIPSGPERIDLALMNAIPSLMQVVKAVTEEMQVESVILAHEIKTHNPQLHSELLTFLDLLQQHQGNTLSISYLTHQQFKQHTQSSQAVIRSGECSPYANIILCAGVTF